MRARAVLAFIFLAFASITCYGQGIIAPQAARQETQTGKTVSLPPALPVTAIKIDARIDGQVAKVKVEHLFRNDTDQELEGTYYFPVPEGATLIEFAVYYGDERRVGKVKEKEEARSLYEGAT
ncbi:MAG TPA: VIT domain-containing protein, partial [Blastocatellia bacterium]|nr:VIT domain-containing protein [Blastocatellia bacterium]